MKSYKLFFLFLSAILLAFTFTTSIQGATKKWTFMVYLDADNNLESAGIADFLEMAKVGSDDNVNIVVQMDRISSVVAASNGDSDDTSYGDWTDAKRFYVTKDMEPTEANAVESLGEVDCGDGTTLKNFIDWAVTNYPAENYALIIWNHGGGWRYLATPSASSEIKTTTLKTNFYNLTYRDVCTDDTTEYNTGASSYLGTKELQQAIANSTVSSNLKLIGFDVCLAGMVEVAYQLRNTASVMVGSEQTEPGDGWPYDTILTALTGNPSMSASELGTNIVNAWDQYYAGQSDVTQSAIDLTKVDTLGSKISTLAETINSYWNSDSSKVKSAAEDVMTALTNVIITEKHGSAWNNKAYGLSINFPTTGPDSDYTSTTIDFAGISWTNFLSSYSSYMTASWIADARKSLTNFGIASTPYVDIYDFCNQLKNSDGGGASSYDCVLVYKLNYSYQNADGKNKVTAYLITEFNSTDSTYGSAWLITYNKKYHTYSSSSVNMAFTANSSNVVAHDTTMVLSSSKIKEKDIGMGKNNKASIAASLKGAGCSYSGITSWAYTTKSSLKFDTKLSKLCNQDGNGTTLKAAVDTIESYLQNKGFFEE